MYQKDAGCFTCTASFLCVTTSTVPPPGAFTGLRHIVKNHKARTTRLHVLILILVELDPRTVTYLFSFFTYFLCSRLQPSSLYSSSCLKSPAFCIGEPFSMAAVAQPTSATAADDVLQSRAKIIMMKAQVFPAPKVQCDVMIACAAGGRHCCMHRRYTICREHCRYSGWVTNEVYSRH